MMRASETQKKIRTRAVRLRRALAKEAEEYGAIRDGAGKRYMIGPLLVQCGDIESALAHYKWFEEACSDDGGEPIHYLFWALALYRSGDLVGARNKLLETMVQNIYLVPRLLGLPFAAEDIWHHSNWAEPGYGRDAPPEFVPSMSAEERAWMKTQLSSEPFSRVRGEYISTYSALNNEHEVKKRKAIVDRWDAFWAGRLTMLFLIFTLLGSRPLCGQEANGPVTDVLVLGVYHFDNPGRDEFNLKIDDYLTAERQQEIEEVNARLADFAPDRIFIEQYVDAQTRIDSLYSSYRNDALDLSSLKGARNEIYQLGFKLGKRLGHHQLYCVAAKNVWFLDGVKAMADSLNITALRDYRERKDLQFKAEQDYMQTHTVLQNLLRINRVSEVMDSHQFYIGVLPQVIDGDMPEAHRIIIQTVDGVEHFGLALEERYLGAELSAEWYRANLKAYANVLHDIRPEDRRILIIIGKGHKRILEHLFEDNPAFNVVRTDTILE